MTGQQIIEAIQSVMRGEAYDPEGTRGLYVAQDAYNAVMRTLRITNPCPVCGGTGMDPEQPNATVLEMLSPKFCPACDGNGFPVEDGFAAIDAWIVADINRRTGAAYGPQGDIAEAIIEG